MSFFVHPLLDILFPASFFRYLLSGILFTTSSLRYPLSDILSPTSSLRYPLSDILFPTTCFRRPPSLPEFGRVGAGRSGHRLGCSPGNSWSTSQQERTKRNGSGSPTYCTTPSPPCLLHLARHTVQQLSSPGSGRDVGRGRAVPGMVVSPGGVFRHSSVPSCPSQKWKQLLLCLVSRACRK